MSCAVSPPAKQDKRTTGIASCVAHSFDFKQKDCGCAGRIGPGALGYLPEDLVEHVGVQLLTRWFKSTDQFDGYIKRVWSHLWTARGGGWIGIDGNLWGFRAAGVFAVEYIGSFTNKRTTETSTFFSIPGMTRRNTTGSLPPPPQTMNCSSVPHPLNWFVIFIGSDNAKPNAQNMVSRPCVVGE